MKRISSLMFIVLLFGGCGGEPTLQNRPDRLEKNQVKTKKNSGNYRIIAGNVTHTCYFYDSRYPFFSNISSSDSAIQNLNNLVKEVSFKIPAIMQNENYKMFRKCKEGVYNNSFPEHSKHILNDECEWCQSEFISDVANLEQGKYFSLLMSVSYTAGGNWAHLGYNSLNLKDNKMITIPNNQATKNKLLYEIDSHLLKQPLIDQYGKSYPILSEIENWDVNDLTFYFKNDTLRLIFVNGANGIENQTFDVSLPKLQNYLNL